MVVGGGVAGATCATELAALCEARGLDDVSVTLVSPSPVVRLTTAGSLRHEVSVSDKTVQAWSSSAGVEVISETATSLDHTCVYLANGTQVNYDACCIATGARPCIPQSLTSCDPRVRERVMIVRDTDSVAKLTQAVAKDRSIAVVGNGGIALELVHELDQCDITWVIRDGHIGGAFFDERVGNVLASHKKQLMYRRATRPAEGIKSLKTKDNSSATSTYGKSVVNSSLPKPTGAGVGPTWLGRRNGPVLFNDQGQRIEQDTRQPGSGTVRVEDGCDVVDAKFCARDDKPVELVLSNGEHICCDVVVCATGVVPNVEWLDNSPMNLRHSELPGTTSSTMPDCNGGVLVRPANMQSIVDKRVFAAGDCSTVVRGSEMDVTTGNNWFQMRLWTQAAMAGRIAAQGMTDFLADSDDPDGGFELDIFLHSTHFLGLPVALLGRYNAQELSDGFEVYEGGGKEGDDYFSRVVVQAGKVRGALLIGDVDMAETLENLILNRLDVGHLGPELVDPSIDLEDYFD